MTQRVFKTPLIFVGGKGGVGKTTIAQALAQLAAQRGAKTLLVSFDENAQHSPKINRSPLGYDTLFCQPQAAFDEYVRLKLRIRPLADFFLKSRLIRYLADAAPGIRELVMVGKVWFETRNYDHVVVDLPSSGFQVTLFQATKNFAKLFKNGLIQTDAQQLTEFFEDRSKTNFLIVALWEDLPITESLELREQMLGLFPKNTPYFLINAEIPKTDQELQITENLVAQSASEYVSNRIKKQSAQIDRLYSKGVKYLAVPLFAESALVDGELIRFLDGRIGADL